MTSGASVSCRTVNFRYFIRRKNVEVVVFLGFFFTHLPESEVTEASRRATPQEKSAESALSAGIYLRGSEDGGLRGRRSVWANCQQ